MNINDLRRQHKKVIVDHAFVIYGITPEINLEKTEWVDYLINGGTFELMVKKLKSSRASVVDGMPELSGRAALIYSELISKIIMRGVA